MRKLFACLVLGLSMFSALAHAIPDWIIPSPITIALQVGKWIITQETEEEVYYIRVQSKGSTETHARNEAFRLAVDQAVGSLLVSETEIRNNEIARHDVINYSSGYIYNFEYVNIHSSANEVVLQVDVWVKKSKIAERISLDSSSHGELEGGRIAEAFKSIQAQEQTSDRLLEIVLQDYPHRAYQSNINSLEYVYEERTPILYINFDVWWNKKYVQSLQEVMSNIGTKADRYDTNFSIGFLKENCVFCDLSKWLLDSEQSYRILSYFMSPPPVVLAQLLDIHGNVVQQGCVYFGNLNGDYHRTSLWEANGAGVNIYPDRWNQETIQYNLQGIEIDKLDTVELSFIKQNLCPGN